VGLDCGVFVVVSAGWEQLDVGVKAFARRVLFPWATEEGLFLFSDDHSDRHRVTVLLVGCEASRIGVQIGVRRNTRKQLRVVRLVLTIALCSIV